MQIHPDPASFKDKASQGNLIPVWTEILADMETPVSAFKKLDDGEFAFLLESVVQGERIGRYSFLSCNPTALIRTRGSEVTVIEDGGPEVRSECPNLLGFLRDYMARYKPVEEPRLPPFIGGAVGYLGYDLVRSFEDIADSNPDQLDVPDCFLMICDSLVVFDHVRRRILIIQNAKVGDSTEDAYAEAVAKIESLAARLKQPRPSPNSEPPRSDGGASRNNAVRSNMTPDEYKDAVEAARQYILAGDAFQIVIAQRFSRDYHGDPFDVYRALRAINPSPYMFYLKFGDLKLAGSSPEVLVTVEGSKVIVRPIAGTRSRGLTDEEDRAMAEELLADPKERAEHIMLVDLSRNDCGRVSEIGSVVVDDLMSIERYSHVMHIVSNVVGKLRPECDALDALQAVFPHGTLSGAPKIRAMDIIDELETVRRGPYGGACGYIGFNGNIDTCITIRTVILKDGQAHVQAGAGIVADSQPELEFKETVSKSKAMLDAIEMAESGLD